MTHLPEKTPVFLEVPSNPTEAGLAVYRSEECDGVVGCVDGSSIDLANGITLLASHRSGRFTIPSWRSAYP
jgi:alcohol dehydrogenase class IV